MCQTTFKLSFAEARLMFKVNISHSLELEHKCDYLNDKTTVPEEKQLIKIAEVYLGVLRNTIW